MFLTKVFFLRHLLSSFLLTFACDPYSIRIRFVIHSLNFDLNRKPNGSASHHITTNIYKNIYLQSVKLRLVSGKTFSMRHTPKIFFLLQKVCRLVSLPFPLFAGWLCCVCRAHKMLFHDLTFCGFSLSLIPSPSISTLSPYFLSCRFKLFDSVEILCCWLFLLKEIFIFITLFRAPIIITECEIAVCMPGAWARNDFFCKKSTATLFVYHP